METILFHHDLVTKSFAQSIIDALTKAGVKVNGGPSAAKTFGLTPAKSLREEYGDLEVTVEIVDSVEQAIDHINRYSSSHTVSKSI